MKMLQSKHSLNKKAHQLVRLCKTRRYLAQFSRPRHKTSTNLHNISETENLFKRKCHMNTTLNRHINGISSWPEVGDDDISSQDVKIFRDYLTVNFKVTSFSSFRENRKILIVVTCSETKSAIYVRRGRRWVHLGPIFRGREPFPSEYEDVQSCHPVNF